MCKSDAIQPQMFYNISITTCSLSIEKHKYLYSFSLKTSLSALYSPTSQPVKLYNSQSGRLMAEPVFGKSNLIYTLIKSDGIVIVPINKSGIYSGDLVDVFIN